jgi:hypothetical protein
MPLRRDPILLALSAPFLAGGVNAMPVVSTWAGKGAAALVALGASAALATTRLPLRCAALAPALVASAVLVWLR